MITIKLKQDFGDSIYLIRDDEQKAYTLVGVKAGPGHLCYQISDGTEVYELYDFECSFDRDEALRLNFDNKV